MVDICVVEFEVQMLYFYSIFDEENESIFMDKKKIIVFGFGFNCIGQGIEFDYCCVYGLLVIKEVGYEVIMVNCNLEIVLIDFDMVDKFYFEFVYWEYFEEIIELEELEGVIVQLGGQMVLKLVKILYEKGIKIIGIDFLSMDFVEDCGVFLDLLKELEILYLCYGIVDDVDKVLEVVNEVGYLVLVCLSYVLGGQDM